MRHILAFACIALFMLPAVSSGQPCPPPDLPGPFLAGWQTVTVQRGSRTMNCRLYYPSSSAGQNAPVLKSGGAPFPMVAFGHGFFMQNSYYNSYFEHLASRGYITIAPQFPDTQHGELALDLLACLDFLRQSGVNPNHFLSGAVDTSKAAVSGHSMGGGASLLAASYDSRILAAAPMCPAETTPSCIARMGQINGAVCIIAGSSDGITPVGTQQQPMYDAASPFKSLAVLQGGNHTRCMDVSTFDWTDPGATMSRPLQQELTRRYMTAVFDYFLKNDTCGGSFSYGVNASHPNVQLSYVTGPQWPVELGEFSVQRKGFDVLLQWRTETETRNFGFEVQRSSDETVFRSIGFVAGAGSTTERKHYEFSDHFKGAAWYRLRQIDIDGTSTFMHARYIGGISTTSEVYPTVLRAGTPGTMFATRTESSLYFSVVNIAGMLIERGSSISPAVGQEFTHQFRLPALLSGMYFLILHSISGLTIHPFSVS